jgi:hypothetical protein
MSEDLWGDILVEKEIKLSVTILKEQATILGEKTNKILEAKVDSFSVPKKDSVGYSLNIIAPALSNYKYKVLSLNHPAIFVYPVTINYQASNGAWTLGSCKDESAFTVKLKEILSSEIVHKAIMALISQSRAAT